MSKAGDVIENLVTGERAVVRVGTEDSGGDLLVSDLYVPVGPSPEVARVLCRGTYGGDPGPSRPRPCKIVNPTFRE